MGFCGKPAAFGRAASGALSFGPSAPGALAEGSGAAGPGATGQVAAGSSMSGVAAFGTTPRSGRRASAGDARRARGAVAFQAGWAAEDQVARHYERQGETVCARRWRGQAGEIDLVARDGECVIFIEVKQSRSHDEAAGHLGPRQMQRIWNAAAEFLAGEPRGQLTEVRLDLALVDGRGEVKVIRDAWMA